MLVAVRGLTLAVTLSLGIFTAGNTDKPQPNPQHEEKTIAVTLIGEPTVPTTVPQPVATHVSPPVAQRPPEYVDDHIMSLWNKVAWCESHGKWYQVYQGSHSFSGGIGIRNDVWVEYGGTEFGATAGNATPREQVIVARRIWAKYGTPNYVPDQNGECHRW